MTKLLWPDLLDTPTYDDTDVVVYDTTAPLPPSAADADVYVVWGRDGRQIAQDATVLSDVRLVQGLLAGTDALQAAGFDDDIALCSGVGLHDRPVAEHTLALVLALVRRLPSCLEAQREQRWASEYAGHQPLHHPGPITTLIDARVLIWGFGSIAATLAPMLAELGAHVRGVARSAGERHGFEVITEDDLEAAMRDTDVLISILPGGDATRHALDAARLAELPEHAYLVNVGRGSTVDEAALIDALNAGRLGGAALDVMETEPLPSDSPLWSAANILLTPHCAGGRPVGAADLVRENLTALREGKPLRNQVAGP